MILIDKLCYTSRLRCVNENLKLMITILSILFCVMSRSILVALLVLFVTGILTVWAGGISFSNYIRLMKVPLIFLLISILTILINLSPEPLSIFSVPFFGKYITIPRSSFFYALQLLLTALASVSSLYFLSLSTPMTDILHALKCFHCPDLLLELMLLVYRFIFLLLEIANAISIAQQSRLGNVSFRASLKSFGFLLSALFIRAFKKSSYLYDAMESRCYDGTIHVLLEKHPIKAKQLWLTISYMIVLSLTVILRSIYQLRI